ncbi:MAG TPA: methyltransferase domain-containing protein, partial [Acidimicrobiales bacterium]
MGDVYSHGHHDSVLRSHRWRTVENSAAYLLAELRSADRVLDVGCGPGTITLDLARRVADGFVVGIDASADVVTQAEQLRLDQRVENAAFFVGDAYHLEVDAGSFDVVHAHQVLQHLTDPVEALVEWRRALRSRGLLAVRDSDYGAFTWWPAEPLLTRWLELYHQLTRRNRATADAGRELLSWVRKAGYVDLVASSSNWTFADG